MTAGISYSNIFIQNYVHDNKFTNFITVIISVPKFILYYLHIIFKDKIKIENSMSTKSLILNI